MNTPTILIYLTSWTAITETAEITSKLKEAEPTIVWGPNSLGNFPKDDIVSATESIISGAEEPSAIRVRLAMVGFQNIFSTSIMFPSASGIYTISDLEVIYSMASINISARIEIPMNIQNRKSR